ncbi:hypothetical protein HNO86_12760 [Pseudomonas sp. C1C7]|nr:hypothetical protein [Pseudomonas sp. C1C7]
MDSFSGGRITFMAPLPLPTLLPPFGPHIGEFTDVHMDFGSGSPKVYFWQVTFGVPLAIACMFAFLLPLFSFFLGLVFGYDALYSWEFAVQLFFESSTFGMKGGFSILLISLAVWQHAHRKRATITPTRFNRQRREVCFMPKGATEPVFAPWESIFAWIIEAKGATQYGVHRQYGMGIGFEHGETLTSLEFPCAALPLVISHWEAIRGYMEYEVNDLKSIQVLQDLQGPDDPPHEGLHTFHNARARMHQQIREGSRSRTSGFFWYLYHVMTLWTIPNHLVEWEVRRFEKIGKKALPDVMREWSEPLPKEQWAKPSEELLRMSERVRQLQKRQPRRPITEIFAQVQRGI